MTFFYVGRWPTADGRLIILKERSESGRFIGEVHTTGHGTHAVAAGEWGADGHYIGADRGLDLDQTLAGYIRE